MSPMSDQPLTVGALATALAQFHREIVAPDMHRTFESLFERLVKPRFDQIDGRFDAVFHKLDKLETEYEALKAGLARVEGRLDVLEAQYRNLLGAVNRLEKRLSRVESQVDALVAATEKDPLRAEVADLRTRVDSLQAQVRSLEKRFDQ